MVIPPRAATLALIALATLLRLGWSAAIGTSTDEAYHWQYARHPALSYFDHPPMTMWIIRFGLAVCGGWVHALSLRLGFILLCAGSTWFLSRWTTHWFGERAGFWAAVGFTLTYFFTAYGSTAAVPDSPLIVFGLLTWWQASVALDDRLSERAKLRAWLFVGLGFGGALLSKYNAVLLPAGVVAYVLLTPGKRRVLRSPGPYLAALIGALMFAPVIAWNAENQWASFRFQGGRATSNAVPVLHGGPLVWLIGPIVFLLPWIWFWLVVEFGRRLRHFASVAGGERMSMIFAGVPLAFFFATSCFNGQFLPHWPVVGFLPLYPLLGARWAAIRLSHPRAFRGMAAWWVGALLVVLTLNYIQIRTGLFPFPAKDDPTRAYSGWESVADELTARGLLDEPGLFLFTNQWDHCGQLAFALRNRVPVTCYHSFDARGFAFWSRPEDYLGRTGLMVVIDEGSEADTRREYGVFFESMTLVAEFPMTRSGRVFFPVKVYRCVNQQVPYPFDFAIRRK